MRRPNKSDLKGVIKWWPITGAALPSDFPDSLSDLIGSLIWGGADNSDLATPNPYNFSLTVIGPWLVRSVFKAGAATGKADFYRVGRLAGTVLVGSVNITR